MVCLRFDARLAALEPDEFIQCVLIDGLGVRYLVVGDDFRFGKARKGDFASLQRAGERNGFEVVNMHTFLVDGERVSSTRVRYALAQGDLATAERLLGRSYRMSGRVAHGDKRGRTIGFPTANIHLHRRASPLQGVFAVEMFGLEGEPVPGVANIGNRPTVGGTKTLLEVHLFDFDRDIYGCHVQVSFVHKLRSEMRFESFDALKQQIELDVQRAREFFVQHYHNA
jgi:riboflavin kinase/FMN adenylyltransferase